MTFYVYSTLTNSNDYVAYMPTDVKSNAIIKKSVTINGGHLLATKHLVTPKGVVTEVSDDDMKVCELDPGFQEHLKNGFLKIEKKNVAPEKIAANMAPKDGSTPKTPKDFDKSESGMNETYKAKK